MYPIAHIAGMMDAVVHGSGERTVSILLTDSRKLSDPDVTLFFALQTTRRDGHQFIPELYEKGVRAFVVSEEFPASAWPGAVFLQVDDTLVALQQLAAAHRSSFDYPVIGITGSNGKTIVKEWLYQLLHTDYSIVRSPRSYNSQTGVPLSIWQMDATHNLALIEAGISEQGEMIKLERMIRPTIGILTNIGEAHSGGFNDQGHKFREKITLFRNARQLIARETDMVPNQESLEWMDENLEYLTWGYADNNTFVLTELRKEPAQSVISLRYRDHLYSFTIPFTDDASVENAITCAAVMLVLGKGDDLHFEKMRHLQPVNMRLELKKGINQCVVINDSYSADLSSLEIALNFLQQQATTEARTVILSDFLQSSLPDEELYQLITELLLQHKVGRLIGIGERISAALAHDMPQGIQTSLYPSAKDFTRQFRASQFRDETILVKGARVFAFENIVQLFEQKAHQTRLEINLNNIAHNLKEYQKFLKPSTKVMAMVKAFAYGSGGAEIAGVLQYHQVDYLGVAYADEGVELRKAGIRLPIMVMNPDEAAFDQILEYRLEPELYSFEILEAFEKYLLQEGQEHFPVHIEIETGMNRLGFAISEIQMLAEKIKSSSCFKLQSAFTHLAASEEAVQDGFTLEQSDKFNRAAEILHRVTGQSFLKHIANSAAVIRHPALQLDMVRLGIGLYGVDSGHSGKLDLRPVATLKSTIAQLKKILPGETVSYNRKARFEKDALIATIRLGYADGYPRRLGHGVGAILVNGHRVPVVGTVCMDMFMADVTAVPGVREGDEVIIFGEDPGVEELADRAGTIPYEIMTGISQRVKRVYFQE
ncbi:MAG: bifunctional UDP-N-acetylmuramoyl-tripeptide:D-alanyl-D-alanine ligase/alanine racemase [Chitinophagaceae bacterium]|nr:bifunctional UDP-N-acetylmuramoyl-tripeptide:D-alanyl-D-alanine ligase/alanine racemase [Chitinophagaceae bacterium]